MQDQPVQQLQDEAEIRAVVLRFAVSLDLQEWEQCRSCFTDEGYTDYSDLRGDPPAEAKPYIFDHDGPTHLMARGPFATEGHQFSLPRSART